jgi:hypothetical protein
MVKIAILGGTGDVYLICALVGAFKRTHNRDDVEVVVKGRYACIPAMFGVAYSVDDAAILRAETDQQMQRDYENVIADDRYFYAHPCFQRMHMRADQMTAHNDASQADMYRMILRVDQDSPLALPALPSRTFVPNTVIVITQSTSWPNNQPRFWDLLALRLRQAGWHVIVNDLSWSLAELFQHCANAEWAVGPQCGVMSILTTGRFHCRKTFVTANVDDNWAPGFVARQTYPYGYVTKFSNDDYDVEEFKVSEGNHDEVASLVVHGSNAMRLWPHDPDPVPTVMMRLSPGDFLDRLAVLAVKRAKFPLDRRAAIEREYQRHAEAKRVLQLPPEVDGLFGQLLDLHAAAFDLLERMVPAAIGDGTVGADDHIAAVRLNKERSAAKAAIDEACRVPFHEQKSYYGEGR